MNEVEELPFYNMRHVHPIRQSGHIPPYYGDYTMEDMRKVNHEINLPNEEYPQSTDIEELLRRVEKLIKLGSRSHKKRSP